ncbi:MAG: nucleotidyltransferase domain-containing protein [Bacteroidota bacterium]
MSPRSAFKALNAMEALGVVRRQRGGRDHLFTLNRDHFLVTQAILPVFQTEIEFTESLSAAIASAVQGKVVSASIFGSVARREETLHSDLDLCCIVRDKQQVNLVESAIDSRAQTLYRRYGVKLSPVIFTVAEFRKKRGLGVVKDILDHGMHITGRDPKSILDDETKRQKIR